MFNFQNPVQSQPFAVPARLNRLLLFCRFDFQQKSWGLPAWEIRRERDSQFSADAATLASAVSKTISGFSDPSLGGAKPPEDRNPPDWNPAFKPSVFGETKQPTKKEK
jgi:hypothetical protein